jgi:hypothetical protein
MKMPVKWHEECLQSRFDTYLRLRQKSDEAVKDADRCQAECAFYARQIGEARASGKDGFDAERFLVGRKKKDVEGNTCVRSEGDL